MAFKPIDPKRDEFRRYLERTGVIEAITKVFVRLIKERERPSDPIQYLKNNLGDNLHQTDTMTYLQNELENAHNKIRRLRDIIECIDPEALKGVFEETELTDTSFKDESNDVKNKKINDALNSLESTDSIISEFKEVATLNENLVQSVTNNTMASKDYPLEPESDVAPTKDTS